MFTSAGTHFTFSLKAFFLVKKKKDAIDGGKKNGESKRLSSPVEAGL